MKKILILLMVFFLKTDVCQAIEPPFPEFEADAGGKSVVRTGGITNAADNYDLARTYEAADSNEAAVIYYQKAIRLDPEYIAAYEGLAHAEAKLGRKMEACITYLKLARIFECAGMAEQVIESKEKALKLNPGSEVLKREIGRARGALYRTFRPPEPPPTTAEIKIREQIAKARDLRGHIFHFDKYAKRDSYYNDKIDALQKRSGEESKILRDLNFVPKKSDPILQALQAAATKKLEILHKALLEEIENDIKRVHADILDCKKRDQAEYEYELIRDASDKEMQKKADEYKERWENEDRERAKENKF